ncbi:cysteine--tRNA ligase [Maricaulis sp.]|uniref:cysteine--tRNA ligase n=1 Tax=Maricaulis sp. TaxID=1486257 RepID=UPI00260DE112|nr:cysteine--tRNA ligase [Maricaulis sp.]
MEVKLYNTMSRATEVFDPIEAGQAGIYTCGPTVYHHAHIGNMRAYVAADVLVRTLRLSGLNVKHVMNITDVGHLTSDEDEGDDKMEVGAAREGITAWDIAERYTVSFFEQSEKLNIKRPNIVCRATDHIAQQITMIEQLEEKGFAYKTDEAVYFDTTKIDDYGKLARLDLEGLRGGERVDLGAKHSKTDFALWKFSRGEKRQMEWDSPWGVGFPGWHIECSAMSAHYLGDQFDIHTGGIDHIPVHHTNEICQSECATGKAPFAKYWLHSEFLRLLDDIKMSKSSGDFLTVFELENRGYDPLAFRLLCLKAHYRTAMKFSWDVLDGAATQYRRMRLAVTALLDQGDADAVADTAADEATARYDTLIRSALYDDLATPVALTHLQAAIGDDTLSAAQKLSLVKTFDGVFGLSLMEPFVEESGSDAGEDVQAMLEARQQARKDKDWAEADRLREAIAAAGYVIVDTPDGPKLEAAKA